MSRYLPKIMHDMDYEGDKIHVEMSPLTKLTFMRVAPSIIESADSDSKDIKRRMATYESGVDALGEHLLVIEGLRDANGSAVAKDVLLRDIYFQSLVLTLFWVLVDKSRPGKATSTGSEEKSPEASTDLG